MAQRGQKSGGKIKNWSRKNRTSHYYEWQHDKGNGKVFLKDHVAGTPQSKKGVHRTRRYQAYYKSQEGFRKPIGPSRTRKEEVKKIAVNWMRDNPSPPAGVV